MAYINFNSLKKVNKDLGVKVKEEDFLNTKEFEINEYFIKYLNRNIEDIGIVASEAAICESLIFPVIKEVACENNLKVFSHIPFDVEGSEVLRGTPDYMIGTIADDATSIKNPVLCLGEAKKEDFATGWGQVAAEMYAANEVNKKDGFEFPVYGLVSTGLIWRFGVLENNLLKIDTKFYSARDLEELLNTLNWVFSECQKNLNSIQ